MDGGGTWALIQAKALANLYPNIKAGHELLSRFNLVAATSGGSIVASALMADMSPAQIIEKFMDESWRKQLFVELSWYDRIPRILGLGPRFSTDKKLTGLQKVLGIWADKSLGQVKSDIEAKQPCPNFLITSFNYDRERIVLFRSNITSTSASKAPPAEPSIAEVVHASTNAPVNFFDKPAEVAGGRFWDGAVSGANNPVLVAVVEALANGVKAEDIRVLSIGTGNTFPPSLRIGQPPIYKKWEDPGLLTDIKKMAGSILDDPPDAATYISHVVLGGKVSAYGGVVTDSKVIRMNPLIQPVSKNGRWEIPHALTEEEFSKLEDMDMAVVEDEPVRLIEKFCEAWMNISANPNTNPVPNQGIRANGDTLELEIGHRTFTEAKVAWLKM